MTSSKQLENLQVRPVAKSFHRHRSENVCHRRQTQRGIFDLLSIPEVERLATDWCGFPPHMPLTMMCNLELDTCRHAAERKFHSPDHWIRRNWKPTPVGHCSCCQKASPRIR